MNVQLEGTPPELPAPATWKRSGGILTILLLGAMVFECRLALFVAPKFEQMFQDMLGTKDKLPVLARTVIEVARFQQANFTWLAPAVLLVLGILWWRRGSGWVSAVCGVLTLAVVVSTALAWVGLALPAAQLVQELGNPVPPVSR